MRSAEVPHSQNGETIGESTVSADVVCGDEFSLKDENYVSPLPKQWDAIA
jgi:hypothetical protein